MNLTAADRTDTAWVAPEQSAGPDRHADPDRTATGPGAHRTGRTGLIDRLRTGRTGPSVRSVGPDRTDAGPDRTGPTPDRTTADDAPTTDPAPAGPVVRSGRDPDRTTGPDRPDDAGAAGATIVDDPAAPAPIKPRWRDRVRDPDVPLSLTLLSLVLDGSVTVMTTLLAATGQIAFAVWSGIANWQRFLVPGITEVFALAFLVKGYIRARRGKSPLLYWAISAAFGGFAVWTNLAHSDNAIAKAANPESLDLLPGGADSAGIIFGAASLACQLLWFVGAYEAYQVYREKSGKKRKARAQFGDLWLTDTRDTFRAWRISGRLNITDVDRCLELASHWIMLFERFRAATFQSVKIQNGQKVTVHKRVGQLLARRSAWREVQILNGAKLLPIPQTAGLAMIGQVTTQTVTQQDAPPPPPPSSADEVLDPDPEKTRAQRRRAAERQADKPRDEEPRAQKSTAGEQTTSDNVSSLSDQVRKDTRAAELIVTVIEEMAKKEFTSWAEMLAWMNANKKGNEVARVVGGRETPDGTGGPLGKNRFYKIRERGEELYPLDPELRRKAA